MKLLFGKIGALYLLAEIVLLQIPTDGIWGQFFDRGLPFAMLAIAVWFLYKRDERHQKSRDEEIKQLKEELAKEREYNRQLIQEVAKRLNGIDDIEELIKQLKDGN